MKPQIKRDWEMARIFFILAGLTILFVFLVQGLILTPTTTPHIRGYSQSVPTPSNTAPHRDADGLSALGRLTVEDYQSSRAERSPAHFPAWISKDKGTASAKDSHTQTISEKE